MTIFKPSQERVVKERKLLMVFADLIFGVPLLSGKVLRLEFFRLKELSKIKRQNK